MLADISNTDSSHALNAIVTGLEKSLGDSQQAVALTQDKRAGNAPQTATLSE